MEKKKSLFFTLACEYSRSLQKRFYFFVIFRREKGNARRASVPRAPCRLALAFARLINTNNACSSISYRNLSLNAPRHWNVS